MRQYKKIPFYGLFPLLLGIWFLSGCEETVEPETFGNITGQVLFSNNQQPVANASITTNPPTEALITNEDGTFVISNVPTGNVTVSIKKAGYKAESRSVRVREDQTTQVFVDLSIDEKGNLAPLAPREPVPATDSRNQDVNLTLNWSPGSDPEGDTLRYDIILFEGDSTTGTLAAQNLTDTTYTLENLRYNTAYYWQVVAKDSSDNTTLSPIWAFKTSDYPSNRILFARDLGANLEIYSSDTATGASTLRLTNLGSREWRPLMSPLRDRIAFTSNAEIETHIYTMSPEGDGLVKVTTLPVAGFHNNGLGYTWSPDGGEFLYSHYDLLYKINRSGFNLRPIARAPAGMNWREMDWTAQNGGKIVALAIGQSFYNSAIYLMDADGTDTVRIVDDLPGSLAGPVFSIDGKSILYTWDISEFESALLDGRQLDSHIFLLNLETGQQTDLSRDKPEGTNDMMPRFSGNGAKIIFTNISNDGSGQPNVYMMDTDGTNRQLLEQNGTTPSWR